MVLRSPPLPNFLTLSDLPPLMRLLITLNISIFINFPLLESDHNSSHHLDEFMNRYNLLNHVNRENYDYILPHTKNQRSCYKRVLRIMKSFSGIYDCFRIRSLNVMSCVVLCYLAQMRLIHLWFRFLMFSVRVCWWMRSNVLTCGIWQTRERRTSQTEGICFWDILTGWVITITIKMMP